MIIPELRPNTKVRYRSDPGVVGWVISLEGQNAKVFINDSVKLVPVNELEPVPSIVELDLSSFKIALTRRRLENPLTEQLMSYRASRTKLYYHQFLPVKKILESPDQRLLIADEVGTGKTIEAGLIWAELEARAPHGLQNVWVICPKALVGKWQQEMLHRFDLRLEQLTPEALRQVLVSLDRDGVLPPRFAQAVVNLELIRNDEHVIRLGQTSIAWDYVIFDEAHHLRNPETLSYGLARFICERSKTAVFLTATPLQTSLEDIVHLMEALGVDISADPRLLEEQIQWDMELNDQIKMFQRRVPEWRQELPKVLDKLELSGGSKRPEWRRLKELLLNTDPGEPWQRASVIQAAHDIQVLAPYMTRTLRSEVDTQRPTREAITRVVNFNAAEEKFYREMYRICLERAQAIGVPPGFATQMPERRAASCAPAVALEILRYAKEKEEEEHQARFSSAEIHQLEPLASAVLGTHDSKFYALVEILRLVFGEVQADRAMIFSTFRGTLSYLAEHLRNEGFSLEVVHGGIPPKDEDCRKGERSREHIAAEFRRGAFQILLASEVAGEGLDFEHCHVIINYDLPWNPMRVEQRIGRCDRIGQKSPKIYVGSLASVGTIEERILSRLYERLHVFERALGDMELILGEQIASFEHDIFTVGLSPKQQDEQLDRIAQVVATIQQQRQSISESSDTFLAGRQLLETDQQEIKEAESRFLSPVEIEDFVYATLERKFPQCMCKLGTPGTYDVVGSKDLKEALRELLRVYPMYHFARTGIVRFAKRLEEGNVRIAFDIADETTEFAHIRHPLVLLARRLAREPLPDTPFCRGMVERKFNTPTLLVWATGSLEGYTNRMELLCVSVDCESGMVSMITPEQANEIMTAMRPLQKNLIPQQYDVGLLKSKAEQCLVEEFDVLIKSFNSRNNLLNEKAKQAVESHAERKLRWLQRQLLRTDLKENIRNLYRGWRQRIEEETKAKLKEIDQKGSVRTALQVIGIAMVLPPKAD